MGQYEKRMLNHLLDSYEASVLSKGITQRTVHIDMRFTKKTMPEYFHVSSNAYEQIHAEVEYLERQGLITIFWKGNRRGHIIEKIRLCENRVEEIYNLLHRTPKAGKEQIISNLLREYRTEMYPHAPVCTTFAAYLSDRLQRHQTIKAYVDVDQPEQLKRLLDTLVCIEQNQKPCFLREFSILHFGDSKELELLNGKLVKIFRQFKVGCVDMEYRDILAEYQIYHTPNYVYLKGCCKVKLGTNSFNLADLHQGIGISGEDLLDIEFEFPNQIRHVMTIENLTTFFRVQEKDCLMIYLGGYHNRARRALLNKIYQTATNLEFFHFGDIDAGGFFIHRHLCEKTEIPFKRRWMDLSTLKAYEQYGKPLTANDRQHLTRMLSEDYAEGDRELQATIAYMLERNIKLEQECIGIGILQNDI